MPTPLLDLAASTREALELRAAIREQAVVRLRSSPGVGHEFLESMSLQHPTALLWSRVVFDQAWIDTASAKLTEDRISALLERESRFQPRFHYQDTAAVFAGWNWQLSDDFAPTCVEGGGEKIAAALQLIEDLWPEALDNIRALTHGVLWFSSEIFFNFSDLRYYGSIFFRPDVLDRSILEIATLIIHEAAHHVIFGELLRDPLIADHPTRTVYSPLRRSQRPIHGVFQSLAALVRMIIWLHQVIDDEGPLDPALRQEAVETCEKYQKDLLLIMPSMQDLAYTEQGRRIFADFAFVADKLE